MSTPEQYDAVIIGSGQGGGPLSTALSQSGKKTVLIEREHVGGCCINEGCTPTKTMIASGHTAFVDRRSFIFGVHSGGVQVDMREVRQRKRRIVNSFREGSRQHILDGGADLIMGEARFTGPRTVEVALLEGGTLSIEAGQIFINTGCRPSTLPIPGLDSVPAYNSTTIMEIGEVPEHLVVLGGGYVGLEFGQLFRRLGSEVTVVQNGPRLMGREDADITEAVTKILQQDGITIILNAATDHAWRDGEGQIHLAVSSSQGQQDIAASHLLVAAGRSPNTEVLNLGAAGVQATSRGFIQVNDRLETDVPEIYAMGDVAGSPQFTHISYDDFRILRDNLLRGGNRNRKDRLIPYTMFIDPELGRVGITEEQALAEGRSVKIATMQMTGSARAIEVDETRGMVKAVVDSDTDEILGAAVLAIAGGEIMAMFEIAMMGKLPYTVLRNGIFAHPTLAELLNNLFASLDVPDARMRDMSNADCGAAGHAAATC